MSKLKLKKSPHEAFDESINILIYDIEDAVTKMVIEPVKELSYKESKEIPYWYFLIINSCTQTVLQLTDLLWIADNTKYFDIESFTRRTSHIIIKGIIEPLEKYQQEEKENLSILDNFKLTIQLILNKFLNNLTNSHFAFFKSFEVILQTEKFISKEINQLEKLSIYPKT